MVDTSSLIVGRHTNGADVRPQVIKPQAGSSHVRKCFIFLFLSSSSSSFPLAIVRPHQLISVLFSTELKSYHRVSNNITELEIDPILLN